MTYSVSKYFKRFYTLLALLIVFHTSAISQIEVPAWIDSVGDKSSLKSDLVLNVNDFGARKNSLIQSTQAIQTAIDSCANAGGGKVVFDEGSYLTGAIYLKSNVHLQIGEGVELRGVIGVDDFPDIDTRVAGIEMRWPSAIINVLNQHNVLISGKGTVHAQGRYHWERYWKLRQEYTPKGLRWASDYDCKRVRTILVSESENITLKDLTLKQAGFWTVHLLYSNQVTVDGIVIQNNIDGHGPSTDGIDIDSSTKILIQNCDIDCNDDNFCLKAGRDADGIRVNRPTEYIVIKDCYSRKGGGLVTIGSETSGEIRHVYVTNLTANETNCAIRFKSAMTRGGGLSNIYISNIKMNNVKIPMEVTLNWNPSYSYASLENYKGSVPDYWRVLLEEVPPSKGIPGFSDVYISNIKATNAETAINVEGIKESYIENFNLQNINISGKNAGQIRFTKNWNLKNVQITSTNGKKLLMDNNVNFESSDSSF
ncbi:glycoside hydrolase family 28 protein [uncultured Draconibacterium sp.]|uniref:glycoside hydrolase family 28 protein n=1 Tax=uncultured Draconibacterium sp. TaxID=1573823 RepID=UPI00321798E3